MYQPHVLLLSAALTVGCASIAQGQPVLDRVVGRNASDKPLIVNALDGPTVGSLAKATGVPMGLEGAPQANLRPWTIIATGKTLRAVLDEIVAADSRYDWTEDDGVVVFRPVLSRRGFGSVLDHVVEPIKLQDLQAIDALNVIAELFGVSRKVEIGPGDTKPFSVDLPSGSLLDALNGIVRAHGTMVWALEQGTLSADFPLAMSLFVNGFGSGVAIPRGAVARGRLLNSVVLREPPARETPTRAVAELDRIVGAARNGEPVVLVGVFAWGIQELAEAAGVPMGLELPPPAERRVVLRPGFSGVSVTGLRLRDALAALAALDPRYEWRDMDGVIVFRPVKAWTDAENPLFRLVNNVRIADASMPEAVAVVNSLLGSTVEGKPSFPDTRRVSVDLPQGTVLDLLNALSAAHGEMAWQWQEISAVERRRMDGLAPELRHMLTFSVFGGGNRGSPVR